MAQLCQDPIVSVLLRSALTRQNAKSEFRSHVAVIRSFPLLELAANEMVTPLNSGAPELTTVIPTSGFELLGGLRRSAQTETVIPLAQFDGLETEHEAPAM